MKNKKKQALKRIAAKFNQENELQPISWVYQKKLTYLLVITDD